MATLRATQRQSGLAAFLTILVLAGCADGAISQDQAGYAPYSPDRSGDVRSGGSDGGDGGGGGGM